MIGCLVVVFDAALPLTTRPIPAAAVLLVVEAVSRGSRRENRGSKPLAYAEDGIPHFWRPESAAGGALVPEVHTCAPGSDMQDHTLTGVHTARLATDVIGHLDIDLNRLTG